MRGLLVEQAFALLRARCKRKSRRRLDRLPKTEATFVDPMECLSVSKLPEGTGWIGKSYVVRHINFFCRVRGYVVLEMQGPLGPLGRGMDPPSMPHNSHQGFAETVSLRLRKPMPEESEE